jgi:superfamily II DNA or RNA helicase
MGQGRAHYARRQLHALATNAGRECHAHRPRTRPLPLYSNPIGVDLTRRLKAYLEQNPQSSALELCLALRKKGIACTKREVNRTLYAGKSRHFERSDEKRPQWRLPGVSIRAAERALAQRRAERAAPPKFDPATRIPLPTRVTYPRKIVRPDLDVRIKKLFRWQEEALNAWRAKKRLGVIEAVTGTGKTMVGIAAAADELQSGGKVLVLVPTIDLQTQWKEKFAEYLPNAVVRERGGGRRCELTDCDILISVVNSARVAKLKPPQGRGLLIADECHRYGSRINQKALSPYFPRRLGLTATLAREDHGHIEWLKPYFWHDVFRVDYRRAKRDRIIAPFRIALIGVRFTPPEYSKYEQLSREASKYRNKLVCEYALPEKPFGEFMRQVNMLKKVHFGSPEGRVAGQFLRAFVARQRLLAETKVKYDALGRLASVVHAAARTIVFTQTKEGARSAARVLRAQGLRVGVVHAEVSRRDRYSILKAFEVGDHQVIVAPRVLDEGIDVPAADLGIIVTASGSKRQMIQRMGRVIRPKKNGGLARFAVLFVERTSEDPSSGAHEAFLEELRDVAEGERTFRPTSGAAGIAAYLKPGRSVAGA